jgi:putative oxidoreductase
MKVGRLLLRAAVGGFFIGHGTQKLFGWFGGQGLKGQSEQFESMGLKPGIVHASAAGAAETLGGAGVLLGYRTPLASASLISVMLTAINRVHLKNGPWAHKGGYEYNAVLIAAAATLAESGPGALSLDALRGKEKAGAKWGIVSLAVGAAGAAGAHFLAESRATPEVVAADAAPATGSHNGTDPVGAAPVETPSEPDPAEETASEETASEQASEAAEASEA